MLFFELFKIMVKNFLSYVLGGALAPIAPPWIRPWSYATVLIAAPSVTCNHFDYLFPTLESEADPASNFRGPISVIFGGQVS